MEIPAEEAERIAEALNGTTIRKAGHGAGGPGGRKPRARLGPAPDDRVLEPLAGPNAGVTDAAA